MSRRIVTVLLPRPDPEPMSPEYRGKDGGPIGGRTAPPTPAEVDTLRLVQSGAVFTFRPARGGPTARDTSQRSKGAWGHLGRKVDAVVQKAVGRGWVKEDEQHSRTEGGQLGHRWRLTDAGTAALEG